MSMQRTMTFGKYKGKPMIWVIATHIGYIMWCLENISNFQLTDEEQTFYDALAISIMRDKVAMTFPIEKLANYVKDEQSLRELKSPFVNVGTHYYLNRDDANGTLIYVYSKCIKIMEQSTNNGCTRDYLHTRKDVSRQKRVLSRLADDIFEYQLGISDLSKD